MRQGQNRHFTLISYHQAAPHQQQGRIWPENEIWGTVLSLLKVRGWTWPFVGSMRMSSPILPYIFQLEKIISFFL
jgi:hypothetical protein